MGILNLYQFGKISVWLAFVNKHTYLLAWQDENRDRLLRILILALTSSEEESCARQPVNA